MQMSQLTALVDAAPCYEGYPPTGAQLPYVVNRPFITDPESVAIAGNAVDWDQQFALYCAGGSVEASFNLAMLVMGELQGAYASGSTLSTSMGYVGAPVEGHYETQVTVQINQGGI